MLLVFCYLNVFIYKMEITPPTSQSCCDNLTSAFLVRFVSHDIFFPTIFTELPLWTHYVFAYAVPSD